MDKDDRKQRDSAADAEGTTRQREQTKESPAQEERRVVATAHADASPANESDDVRPIGNTDVPVTARDPDA